MLKKQHLKFLVLVISIFYPFIVHYLIVSEQYLPAGIYIVSLIFIVALQNFLSGNKILSMAVASVAVCSLIILFYSIELVIMLPPVLIPLAWAYLFGISLFKNKTALITTIAQKIRKRELELSEKRYTRFVTQLWFVFFIAISIESIVVAVFYDFETWSYVTNFLNYLLIAFFMFIEFTLRKIILKNIKHPGFFKFLKQLVSVQRS